MDRLLRQRRVGRKQMFPAAESGREVQGAAIVAAAVVDGVTVAAAEAAETVVAEADGTVAGIAEEILAVEAAKAGVDTDRKYNDA
jgi:H2-forming N5,N10-methylenetetrahydromethanopterin dehydrogenase-like enzyme